MSFDRSQEERFEWLWNEFALAEFETVLLPVDNTAPGLDRIRYPMLTYVSAKRFLLEFYN